MFAYGRAMSTRSSVRRSPSQARSRFTIKVLLEAAERTLGSRGLAGTTTRTVARLAGVSVGSLYQYFPSRDGLLQAVLRGRMEREEGALTAGLERVRDLPLREAIASLGASFQSDQQWEVALYPALHPLLGPLGMSRALDELLTRATVLVAQELTRRRAELRPDVDPKLAATLLVRGLPAAGLELYKQRPEYPCAQLVDELARMALGYLV